VRLILPRGNTLGAVGCVVHTHLRTRPCHVPHGACVGNENVRGAGARLGAGTLQVSKVHAPRAGAHTVRQVVRSLKGSLRGRLVAAVVLGGKACGGGGAAAASSAATDAASPTAASASSAAAESAAATAAAAGTGAEAAPCTRSPCLLVFHFLSGRLLGKS
jgi:hypothetical protein